MGIPDTWTNYLKNIRDENWSVKHLVATLCNRRFTEKVVAYCESHDQALVGDKTIGAPPRLATIFRFATLASRTHLCAQC